GAGPHEQAGGADEEEVADHAGGVDAVVGALGRGGGGAHFDLRGITWRQRSQNAIAPAAAGQAALGRGNLLPLLVLSFEHKRKQHSMAALQTAPLTGVDAAYGSGLSWVGREAVMAGLTYHRATFELLAQEPRASAAARLLIEEAERSRGVRMPGSV